MPRRASACRPACAPGLDRARLGRPEAVRRSVRQTRRMAASIGLVAERGRGRRRQRTSARRCRKLPSTVFAGARAVNSKIAAGFRPTLSEVPAYAHPRAPARSADASVALLVVCARRRPRRHRRRANAVRALLRQEQHPLRQVRLAHLHDRPLRDLLLPGARAAPRAGRRLRRERLPADQRGPEARPARSRCR